MTYDQFSIIAATVGNNPSESQQNRLVSIITQSLPKDLWASAALECGGDVYTDISERLGECGIF